MNTARQWPVRILIGGLTGMAALFLIGGVFNDLVHGGLISMGVHPPFQAVSSELIWRVGSKPLAAVLQFALYFALGAGVGVATLPFAEDGKRLFLLSALHFVYTAAVFSALVWLCGWNWGAWSVWLAELALLALVYLLIWGVRWVFWYAELRQMRKALGLEGRRVKKEKQNHETDQAL